MEENSRSYNYSQLVSLFFVIIIIGLTSCGYVPSVDRVNKLMIQEKEQFDYLKSVVKRLDSKYNFCEYYLNVDYLSYRSSFSLTEESQASTTTIKSLLYFELDDIGNKKVEKSDSFQKYISADLLPMFDSINQIRKNLNCKSISIYKSFIELVYIGDVILYVTHKNKVDTFKWLPTHCDNDLSIDSLNKYDENNSEPYGFKLNQENWYYVVSKGCHGIN